ncbi:MULTISPECIES: hypothetical protein [Okeania]|uniref:Uncharacterized protein n=1 Tax=Okeania hirsuta TaxID=1458930 RepID=A0A3N6P2C7_9CYAN|nr:MULTISPECIES: hypothetical protein [Okeania]NEP40751.1 hypothetical protein [Okeania sp. SIO2H7]NET15028.1 hypothetical protein [Okeania sp. SIO1H6]NEP74612.1 hypothetical protein [Okeania sp. SIO2G5]NEP95693.1 hypothetical protein [Okeania sp. SIO2F5]NEQ93443.1 hypothetical protein [Okeania sp. SIO2G4]
MFLDELTPVVKELIEQPVAFFGGFFSGMFRLNLNDDPVKSWLEKQNGYTATTNSNTEVNSDKSEGPQSITIE